MKREEVHRSWAPADGAWSAWVKPVLFASLDEEVAPAPLPPPPTWLGRGAIGPLADAQPAADDAPHPYRADGRLRDVAVVVDLPGSAGALVGVALADFGFRPIPLYNAVPSRFGVVELRPIMKVLVDASERVAPLPTGAPPAFLLDAQRTTAARRIAPGAFDNRSVCRVSDFPSAETLLRAGIRRVLIIQADDARPAADLEPSLFAWQGRGVSLWRKAADAESVAAPFVLRRRPWPSRVAHAIGRALLHRRDDDSYGHFIPTGG